MRPVTLVSIYLLLACGTAFSLHSAEVKSYSDAWFLTKKALMKTKQQANQQTRESTLLSTARRLRLQGKYSDAAGVYSTFIKDFPNSSKLYEARFWCAKSLFADEKWDEAASAFSVFLSNHSDQRTYSQQAKEDRIYCWKTLYNKNPKAVIGLVEALKDPNEDIRIFAALALAENQNGAGRQVLEQGTEHARFSDQCNLGLWKLGLGRKPGDRSSNVARIIVIKVKTEEDSFVSRIPLNFITFIEKNLPKEAREQMAQNGISDISELTKLATNATKGTVLFKYIGDKGKTSVIISVE
ncbi:MAG: tetratricopeptide repeat protein [Holophagaceae bacterium]|nr:tetratricopeptide repeat protein [Holophagaceae bacterium]